MTGSGDQMHAAFDQVREFERRQRDDEISAEIVQSERIDTALRTSGATDQRS